MGVTPGQLARDSNESLPDQRALTCWRLGQYSAHEQHTETPAKRVGEEVPAQRGKTVRLTLNPNAGPFAVRPFSEIPGSSSQFQRNRNDAARRAAGGGGSGVGTQWRRAIGCAGVLAREGRKERGTQEVLRRRGGFQAEH